MNQQTTPILLSDQPEDAMDLHDLIGMVQEARWLIAGIAAAALVLGGLYAQVATPVYQVNSLVQVEDNKGGGLGAVTSELSGLFEGKTQAVTEIELIRSRMVLGKTVADLGLDISATPQYFPLIGKLWAGSEPRHIEVARFEVPRELQDENFTLIWLGQNRYQLRGPDDENLGQGRVNETLGLVWQGQTIGLFVRDLVAPIGQRFRLLKRDRLDAIEVVSKLLSLSEKGKQSGIIAMTYQSPDPDQAAKVLNQIANNYVRQNVERKSAEAQQTLEFLDQQLPDIKKQLEAAEVRFNEFRTRTGSVDITKEGELLLQQSVVAETGLLELQQKRKELLARFTAEHPSVQALDKQIGALQAEQGQYSGRVDKLPKTQQELLRLTRDVQVNQELYTTLLNNAQQLKVVKAGTVGNARVVDYAQPALQPVAPNKPLLLVLSLLLGLMAGVGLAFLRRALRNGVKDASQIEARTGVSVLATVPDSKIQRKLARQLSKQGGQLSVLAHAQPDDLAIEALRSLRTSMHFALIDAANNVIMITGPSPNLGKSFLSANLAALLASGSRRVLLIDADLRRGHLNEYFGVPRDHGLSELIAGQCEAASVIRASGLPGFDYVATGALPPNPSELLLHPRFEQFLRDMSGRYDHVIVDSPPVMAVTDAAIVGRHAGATLLIAAFGQTPMREIEHSLKRLGQAGVAVKGVLLNRVSATASGYGYGYKYAYAYKYQRRDS